MQVNSTMGTILVTGATGAIGIEVLKQLTNVYPQEQIAVIARNTSRNRKKLAKYSNIRIHYGDLLNPETFIEACAGVSTVIHLAGIIPPESIKRPALAERVNVEGTRNLVNALEHVAPNAFLIYSSSVTVYGDRLKNPNITINDPIKTSPFDVYANSKVRAEEIIINSKLNWAIFRLAAIMGVGNHKVSKIMFHVPLETKMEIATVRDTARAFVKAPQFRSSLNKKIFNLGGGEDCQTTYKDLITEAFKAYGLGSINFRPHSFATANFHCGIYKDGSVLEEIIEFRGDTLESYYSELRSSVHPLLRNITIIVRRPVKLYLGRLSEPRSAYLNKDPDTMKRFFGNDE